MSSAEGELFDEKRQDKEMDLEDEFRALASGNINIVDFLTANGSNGVGAGASAGDLRDLNVDDLLPVIKDTGQRPPQSAAEAMYDAVPPNVSLNPLTHQVMADVRAAPMPQQFCAGLPDSPPDTDPGCSPISGGVSDSNPYSPPHNNQPTFYPQGVSYPGVITGTNVQQQAYFPQQYVNVGETIQGASGYPSPPLQQLSPSGYQPNCAGVSPQQAYQHPSEEAGPNRKRVRTDIGYDPAIKPEPVSPNYITGATPSACAVSPMESESDYSVIGQASDLSAPNQFIRFTEFQVDQWHALCDEQYNELAPIGFQIMADKGFSYSPNDSAFINQKKNHFQITVQIEMRDRATPRFVRVPGDAGGLKPISEFQLDFFGFKHELPTHHIAVRQSQADRKFTNYQPYPLELPSSKITKVTVQRLHFSETTMNNQRKNGRSNPDQKYFQLGVQLNAIVQGKEKYLLVGYASEKVIVRASNPGQFDSGETENQWQRGQTPGSLYCQGPVGIGTPQPTATLHVLGDAHVTGKITNPSDERLKQNIHEVDSSAALDRMAQIRIVRYEFKPDVAEKLGMKPTDVSRVGVIAQEVEALLPDAVKNEGEYLHVDENRIFFESAAAVQELHKLTGNLENKIGEVEKIARKCNRMARSSRFDSVRSSNVSIDSGVSRLTRPDSEASYDPKARGDKMSEDKGGFLSCFPSKKKPEERPPRSKRSMRHHCARHRCRRQANTSLCSSRIMQVTIVALVIVMAFCLICMSSLYILDWQKRRDQAVMLADVLKKGLEFNGTDLGNWRGIGHMIKNNQSGSPFTIQPWDPAIHPPPVSGPPLYRLHCVHIDCEYFCCPGISTKAVSQPPLLSDTAPSDSFYASLSPTTDAPDILAVTKGKPPLGAGFAGKTSAEATTEATGVEENRVRRSEKDTAGDRPDGYYHYSWSSLPDVPILISNLNVSLDERYRCHQCSRDAGNYTYYVPVSRYLPHIPLEISFDVSSDQTIELCSFDTGQPCSGITTPPNAVPRRRLARWELPVGSHMRSKYVFRVAFSSPCNLPADEIGATFNEYHLNFYRVCSF